MHVLDPADVVDPIHDDPSAQRLAGNVADQVTVVLSGVDAVVRVEQFDLKDCGVIAAHGDGVGILRGDLFGLLAGIVEHDTF